MIERMDPQTAGKKIDNIEVFRFDVDVIRHFSFGNWDSRQIAFISISAGGVSGWGENRITSNNKNVDTAAWAECFAILRGQPLSRALEIVAEQRTAWGPLRSEMAEMALIDLTGKLQNISAFELLDMPGTDPVAGLYCVLENEPEKAAAMAKVGMEMNYRTHIKIKLFGDNDLDASIISAVREVVGEAYIVGDVNCGYRKQETNEPVDAIAGKLRHLHDAGLDACEDPACLNNKQWIELQNSVGKLDLIPDYCMRPATAGLKRIEQGMGRIYNIHPGCMGSVIEAVKLAEKVKSLGAKLMIGDDSLIGPALTSWQQIAIGLGAEWVEAVEKQGESEVFLECVRSQITAREPDGTIAVKKTAPGFGQEIDADKLRDAAFAYITV